MSKLQELLKKSYNKYGDNEFISYIEEDKKITKTFKETIYDVLSLSEFLISKKLLDKNILIVGKNSYEWLISWTSIISYVGVAIPINNLWTSSNIKNILKNIDVSCIIYSKDYTEISKIKEEYKKIEYVCLDDIQSMILEGRKILENKQDIFLFDKIDDNKACELNVDSAILDDVNFITYTSNNLLANFKNFNKRLPLNQNDKVYFYLQMSNTYINLYAYLYSYYTGNKVYIGNIANMCEELKIESPSVIFGVESTYKNILKYYGDKNVQKLKKKIDTSMTLKNLRINVDKKKYFKKMYEFLGGNIKYLVSYGKFLDKNTKKIFLSIGLKIQTMYGVNGATSLISFEYFDDEESYSEGTILEDSMVKIYEPNEMNYGEIIIKGDTVTSCYYNDVEKTKEVFDYNGYYHTKELGCIKDGGKLFLIGSMENKITFDSLETIYPDKIEKLVLNTNKFATAKIYEKNGKLNLNVVTDIENNMVQNIVEDINSKLPKYMQIDEYHIKKNRFS